METANLFVVQNGITVPIPPTMEAEERGAPGTIDAYVVSIAGAIVPPEAPSEPPPEE